MGSWLQAGWLLTPGRSDTLKASARLVIDCTKYNIKFRSGLLSKDPGDALIYDDFTLTVQLTARAL